MTLDDFVRNEVSAQFVDAGGEKEAAFDPASILVWMEIAKELISMLQQCKGANQVSATAKNPTFFERRALTNSVRRSLGVVGFIRHGRATVDAFRAAGAKLSAEDAQSLYDEV